MTERLPTAQEAEVPAVVVTDNDTRDAGWLARVGDPDCSTGSCEQAGWPLYYDGWWATNTGRVALKQAREAGIVG